MNELKKLTTAVILSIIDAYSAYFERDLTEAERIDRKMTINFLQLEIESRQLNPTTSLMARA